ncbi:MAG: hypothetical protein F6J95_019670 [Leptolyngbya sp. SIO1E4]|nr:hypothetical protein [Leptolyngbya sp. SIO1E4]
MTIDFRDITDVYVFGDSLSDTGSFFTLTMEQIPPPPYDRGRLSNGLVAVEYLVDRLQSESNQDLTVAPSLLGGTNFAIAGAATGRTNSNDDDLGADLPGMLDQVEVFAQQLEAMGLEQADPNGLYIAWAGANNFLDNLAGSNLEDPALLLEQGINDYIEAIARLIALGARDIVVPNLSNLDRLPINPVFRTDATAITRIFNGELALALGNLEFELDGSDFTVVDVDLFTRSEQIATDPQRFGLTNVTDPLLPLVADGQLPPDAPGFFFWDEFHPTTQAHALLAETIFDTLTGDIPQLSFNDILGTPDSELLLGTQQADNVDGFAGHDTIFGLADADRIEGWQGNDWLFGNSGDDTLSGGEDDDVLFGGSGDDLLLGKSGNDWQYGDRGDDLIVGGDDRDQAWGGSGDDFMLGGAGDDSLWGNQGDDSLSGGAGQDSLRGGSDNDQLMGGADDDLLWGDRGDDQLDGGIGNDILDGGQGQDVARYLSSSGDYIFKGNPDDIRVIGPEGRDILNNIEALEFADGLIEVDDLAFLPAPLFDQVQTLETEIPTSGNAVDIYYPVAGNSADEGGSLPVALFLQGADVDKSNYAEFASVVASYGFAVLVPNNLRTLAAPPPAPSEMGLFSELPQVTEALAYVQNPDLSPIADLIDPEKLVLLGHSFGGAVGLSALQGGCPANFPVCPFGEFEQPDELVGAAFFGTNLRPPAGVGGGDILPIENMDIPTALISGNNDGITLPEDTIETYDAIVNPPKMLVEVAGTNHYGITDSNPPVNPPDTPDTISPVLESNAQELNQRVAIDTIATWSAQFLRATVLDDPIAFEFVFGGIGDQLDKNVEVVAQLPADPLAPTPSFLPLPTEMG